MKRIKGIIIVIILLVGFCACNYYEHNYTKRNCTITDVKGSTIYIKDDEGYLWTYQLTNNDFKPNDKVELKMNDNCTDSYIQDDIIKSIKRVDK